ncbi:MAG: thioredoxin family protein [Proteobacteria bacterium]|nr:thioredoxin family protein [Pseudomonadota bacterium]
MKTQAFVFIALFSFSAFSCSTKSLNGIDLRTGKHFESEKNSAQRGRVVVFLSAKCPCSRSHESSLKELANEFSDFSFIGVHSNKDEDEGLSSIYFRERGLNFPIIQDKESRIANDFGAMKTPHAFIVGPSGECWFNGGVDDTKDASKAKQFYLKQALLDLRSGKEPEQKTTRTLGCTIMR